MGGDRQENFTSPRASFDWCPEMNKPTLLIGSRALEWHLRRANRGSPARPAVDWDFAGSIFAATDFVEDHRQDILSIEEYREPLDAEDSFQPDEECGPCKFIFRLRDGSRIEWEVSEYVKSLDNICQTDSNSITTKVDAKAFVFHQHDVQIPFSLANEGELRVLNIEALILMKLSHIWWPIHWKKTAQDLVQFCQSFPSCFAAPTTPLSLDSILDSVHDNASKVYLRTFYEDHTAEIASRWIRNHPQEQRSEISIISTDLESQFSAFSPSHDSKLKFVQAWLEATALAFLTQIIAEKDSPKLAAGSWLHDASITRSVLARECWIWALQSLVPDRTVAIPASPSASGELNHMSTFERIQELVYDGNGRDVLAHIYCQRAIKKSNHIPEVDKAASYTYAIGFLDDITYEQALESSPHIMKPVVLFATSNLPALLPPTELFKHKFDEKLGSLLSPAPELPSEIWQTICFLSNHLAVCRMSQTCRKMKQSIDGSDSPVWDMLGKRCWKQPSSVPSPATDAKAIFLREHSLRWQKLKHPTFSCSHCKLNHECISHYEWQEYLTAEDKDHEFVEFAESWCICPTCTANSWSSCPQHYEQFTD